LNLEPVGWANVMKQTQERMTIDLPGQLFFDFAASAPVQESQTDSQSLPVSRQAEAPKTPLLRPRQLPAPLRSTHAAIASTASFMTESQAAEIFLAQALARKEPLIQRVAVDFHPFRATLYSFKIYRGGLARIKLHVAFRRASPAVVAQAAQLILCRRRGKRPAERAEYDAFVRGIPESDFELPGARRGHSLAVKGPGVHRSLEDSFNRVNVEYFQAQLQPPDLCWSPVRARRLLGSYHQRKDRVIISRLFDSPKIPEYVLDYLMYHELLHKFLGIGRKDDGRRCVHSAEFRELEQRFRRFKEAQEFLKKV